MLKPYPQAGHRTDRGTKIARNYEAFAVLETGPGLSLIQMMLHKRLKHIVVALAMAVPAAAQENAGGPSRPDAKTERALLGALDAVEKRTAAVRSLSAAYTRVYTRFGRTGFLEEKGALLWKRARMPGADRNEPEIVLSRWEGRDEDGPLLTLVRGRDVTIWRGAKKERETTLEDPSFLHASRFGFPLIPAGARSAFDLGGPDTSPEYDDRFPATIGAGIPRCLTFLPRSATPLYKMLSLLFDDEVGLAYRIRCDSNGWDYFAVDLTDWQMNPSIPDDAFKRPDASGEDSGRSGNGRKADVDPAEPAKKN